MTSTRHPSRRDVGTFLLAGTLLLAAGCATAPEPALEARRADAAPAADCVRLQEEIARTEHERSAAAEQSGNAWKAVVPFAVLALKASGTAAVQEADRKLAALKEQAGHCTTS